MFGGRTASAVLIVISMAAACTPGQPRTTLSNGRSSSIPSPVPSGVFVSVNFHPKVTFHLTSLLDHTRDGPALVTVDGDRSQPVNIFDVSEVYDPRSGHLVPPPGDLVAWLRANPYLDAGPSKTLRVGGSPAIQVDVKVARAPAASSPLHCAPGCLSLFQMGLDRLALGRGGRARFIVVQTQSASVVIEFAATPAGFDAFAATAQRLIDTVRFPPIS